MKIVPIYEEIDAKDAYTDSGAIKTLIKEKRDVAFIEVTKEHASKFEKYKISIIPLRMTSRNTMKAVVFRNTPDGKLRALKLFSIAKSKNGYLRDDSPEEAREIGQLLGYNEKSINEYIWKKYVSKLPEEPNPDDLSDI